jgi:hypothetical protein
MNFLKQVKDLCDGYKDLYSLRDNALLYGVYKQAPPLAEHIIYSPMPNNIIQNLVENYTHTFPSELLTLYKAMNGADLFWIVRHIGNRRIKITHALLSIYGVPLTVDRKHIEPFNIIIEDLNRPKNTPSCWLKFGSYYKKEDTDRLDLFVDTQTANVYSVTHGSDNCCVIDTWDTIDICLSSILRELRNRM